MADKPLTWQEIIRRRQQLGFVGRQEHLTRFRENFALPADDPGRCLLFNVHGDAGVGKTYLVRQLAGVAREIGARSVVTDDGAHDVPETLSAIAAGLERSQQSKELNEFHERHGVYQQRRHELTADPEAPPGAALLAARTIVKVGLRVGRGVPVVGPIAEVVDADTIVDQAEQLRLFLSRKFRNSDDVHLMLSPEEALTPPLLRGVSAIATQQPIALFFDTYERTAPFLDDWLLALVEGRFGELPSNLVLTVAGQYPLDAGRWEAYAAAGLVADIPLVPFTEHEARQYLAQQGVTAEPVIQVIMGLSGGLPLLIAMLAEGRPEDPMVIGDPSGSAVERFLRWEDDERRRSVALAAALPRFLNQDVLAALFAAEDAGKLFAWLRARPFVTERSAGWQYHQVVRAPMLRHLRKQSPQAWPSQHQALAEHFHQRRATLQLSDKEGWQDETWQSLLLEELYHQLCAAAATAVPVALNQLVRAFDVAHTVARRWAETFQQAGDDADDALIRQWAERLHLATVAAATERKDWMETLSALISSSQLARDGQVVALIERAELHGRADDFMQALADVDRASDLDPKCARAFYVRGNTNGAMGRYEEAVADFTRAIDLDPKRAWILVERGRTYRAMERDEEAVADYTRAIDLDPQDPWALAQRGEAHRLMGRYEEALADYTRAIDLDPKYAWAVGSRGQAYRRMGRYEEALADLTRAIDLDPKHAWAVGGRGETYRRMGRYEEALADLTRAIDLDPESDWYYYARAVVALEQSRPDRAEGDLKRAVALGRKAHEQDPEDRLVTRNLAVYELASGAYHQAEALCREALQAGATQYEIRDTVVDLLDLRRVIEPSRVDHLIGFLQGDCNL